MEMVLYLEYQGSQKCLPEHHMSAAYSRCTASDLIFNYYFRSLVFSFIIPYFKATSSASSVTIRAIVTVQFVYPSFIFGQ